MAHKMMYLALAMALGIVSWCLIGQYNHAAAPLEETFWKNIEPITFDEVLVQYKAMRQLAEKPEGGAITYFSKIIVPNRMLQLRIQATLRNRYRATENPGWAGLKRYQELTACNYGPCIMPVAMQSYDKVYGKTALHNARLEFEKTHGESLSIPTPERPDSFPFWRIWYGITLILAFMFFVVRTDEKGLTVWIELFQPQMALAVIAWPVFMWKYPSHTPVQQLRWAMRYVSFVFSFLLSAGAAWAAPKAKNNNTKRDRKEKWTLQTDFRLSRALDSTPNPAGQLRATVTDPHGRIFETISVVRAGGYGYNSTVIGTPLVRPGAFLVLATAGVANDTRGVHTVLGGIQIYGSRKRWGVAMPSLGVERTVSPTHVTTFSNGGWVFAKPTPHTRMGIRYGITKTVGKPLSWSVGLFGAYAWGSKLHLAESSVMGNNIGRLEARYVHSF